MGIGKARESCEVFIDLGVVLHGAASKRVKPVVYSVVHFGEVSVVSHELRLTQVGDPWRMCPPKGGGNQLLNPLFGDIQRWEKPSNSFGQFVVEDSVH